MIEQRINFQNLFKLRLVVARFGEMDINRWWNTRGILGKYGSVALRRGMPRTHRFAQARIALSVARNRCKELFDPPGCTTLWDLPAQIEELFEAQWPIWLNESNKWDSFFEEIEFRSERICLYR